jgi:hypothetical protein
VQGCDFVEGSARRSGVDGHDELEIGRAEHRRADCRSHVPSGSEYSNAQHPITVPVARNILMVSSREMA